MPKFLGVELDVPSAEYRASEGLCQSELKEFARTPAHYKAYCAAPPKQTAAMRFGELVHLAVFQPDLFVDRTAVAPVLDKRTKVGQQMWAEFETAHAGKLIVTSEEHVQIAAIATEVRSHREVKYFLAEGNPEVSAWAEDADSGILCKGRFDWLRPNFIVDLKTTEDAGPAAFARSVANFKYHWQAAHYLALAESLGIGRPEFAFIAVEKTPPYGVAVYQLSEQDLCKASDERDALLERFAWCQEHDEWPCYGPGIEPLQLPAWGWTKAVAEV